jgi:hypothetical protein
MITVCLGGGLGNQMFQYAAARSLAARHRTNVRLDLYNFRKATKRLDDPAGRPYALDRFALPGSMVAGKVYGRAMRHLRRIESGQTRRLAMPNLFKEEMGDRDYNPEFERLPDGTYLWGFFQSYRYFADTAAQLRADFAPKDPASVTRIEAAVRDIRRRRRPLVSLHVRRGDQLLFDGLALPDQQRQAAMAEFGDADFLVISDDLAWCQANIRGTNVFYSPFQSVIDDFWAMTRCDHNIIANSTFSWWAAWLNPNPDRVVVAPLRSGHDNADFYPPGWRLV